MFNIPDLLFNFPGFSVHLPPDWAFKILRITHETRASVMIADRTTLSIAKAGELVGVTRRTIYNWIAGGKVEYVRTAGGSVRIFVDTLWRDPHAGVTRPDTHGTWEDVSTPSEV